MKQENKYSQKPRALRDSKQRLYLREALATTEAEVVMAEDLEAGDTVEAAIMVEALTPVHAAAPDRWDIHPIHGSQ